MGEQVSCLFELCLGLGAACYPKPFPYLPESLDPVHPADRQKSDVHQFTDAGRPITPQNNPSALAPLLKPAIQRSTAGMPV